MTIPAIGTIAGPAELMGRWLYSELDPAGRWHDDRLAEFMDGKLAPVVEKASAGVSYEELTAEQKALIHGRGSAQVGRLTSLLNAFPVYRLEEWPRDLLLQAFVVPALNPAKDGRPFALSNLAKLPPPEEPKHPLASAEARRGSPIAAWPIAIPISLREELQWMLLDGTSRSLGFLAGSSDGAMLPVWTALPTTVVRL